jgi:hypothetical protein
LLFSTLQSSVTVLHLSAQLSINSAHRSVIVRVLLNYIRIRSFQVSYCVGLVIGTIHCVAVLLVLDVCLIKQTWSNVYSMLQSILLLIPALICNTLDSQFYVC